MDKYYGVGFVGPGKYNTYIDRKPYEIWYKILERCYSKKHLIKKPTYNAIEISEDWYDFQNFAKWYYENYKDNFCIDKDLIGKNKNIYFSETCCFIPYEINNSLIIKNNKLGFPPGISLSNKFYRVKINKFGKQIHIGVCETLDEGISLFKKAKEKYLIELAEKWKNEISENVYNILINYDFNYKEHKKIY